MSLNAKWGKYQGPDVRENIVILCPYHLAEFDYGSIAINPDTELICRIDLNNKYNGKKQNYNRDDTDKDFIKYYYDAIFNKIFRIK